MKVDDKKYQIALTLVEGVGDVIGKKLLSHLGSAKAVFLATKEQLHIDTIVEKLGWSFSKVANELLQAEFKGLITSLPGKIYKKNI